MAIATTVRGTISSSTNTDTYTTSSFTPTAGELLVLFVELQTLLGIASVSDSQGGAWTRITSSTRSAGADAAYAYVRTSTAPASSMTVTISIAQDDTIPDAPSASGCNAGVFSLVDANGTGAAAITQSQTANSAGSSTPTATFSSTTATGNATLLCVFNNTNPSGVTNPTGWSDGSNIGHTLPTCGLRTSYRNSGFAGTAVTWGSSATNWAVIMLEVNAAASSSPASTLPPTIAVTNAIPATLIGKVCDKNAGSQTLSCTTSVSGRTKVVLFIAHDPGITVTGLTDSKGNLYSSVGSITNGSGTSGVTTTCYRSDLAYQLTASVDTIVATFSASRGAACMVALGSNLNFSVLEGTNTHQATGTAPSTTVTPVVVPAYGFVGCGVEGPSGDTYTDDADWTQIGRDGTTGGADASNVSLNASWLPIAAVAAMPYTPTLGTSRLFAQFEVVYSYADTDPQIGENKYLPLLGIGS